VNQSTGGDKCLLVPRFSRGHFSPRGFYEFGELRASERKILKLRLVNLFGGLCHFELGSGKLIEPQEIQENHKDLPHEFVFPATWPVRQPRFQGFSLIFKGKALATRLLARHIQFLK